jgi:hypothetical protein
MTVSLLLAWDDARRAARPRGWAAAALVLGVEVDTLLSLTAW